MVLRIRIFMVSGLLGVLCVCVDVLLVKNPSALAGDKRDAGSIRGSGRSPGGGHGNSLHYPFFFFHLFLLVGGWLLYNIVVVSVIHWHESAMELHVFPIPSPAPTSLSTRSLWVFPVHQVRALVSCIRYCCLENPMDREAWRAKVHNIAESQTWLKRQSLCF